MDLNAVYEPDVQMKISWTTKKTKTKFKKKKQLKL